MGHTVNPATPGGNGINIQLHDIAPRVQRRQQRPSLFIRLRITKLRRDDRAIDHEVIDVSGRKVFIALAEPVTPPALWR